MHYALSCPGVGHASILPPLISSCFSLSTTINSGLILLFFILSSPFLPLLPLLLRCHFQGD